MQPKGYNMQNNLEIIKKNQLFDGISTEEIKRILAGKSARFCKFEEDSFIFLRGDIIDFVGIVLSGSIAIIKEDSNGNRSIISEVTRSESFGTALCATKTKSMFSAVALKDSSVLLMEYEKIFDSSSDLSRNFIKLLAYKVLNINQKVNILSKRTIRDKLLAYFEMQSELYHSKAFSIPYNREELADYLFVDRSAMSRELSNMRNEGLISFYKSNFILHI